MIVMVVPEQHKVLIEASGVNLEIVRQDMVGGFYDMQIKSAEEWIKVSCLS
jgi:hypothetical protein